MMRDAEAAVKHLNDAGAANALK